MKRADGTAITLAAAILVGCGAGDDIGGGGRRTGSGVDTVGPTQGPLMTVYHDTVPTCASCEVRLTPAGAFGSLDDEILLRGTPIVERDSRGFLYAAVPNESDHELVVYAADGRIVRTVGRTGRGPGEFPSVDDLFVGPGDTLFVLSRGTVSLFDPEGAFLRSSLLEGRLSRHREFVVLRDGRLVFSETFGSHDSIKAPVHEYDADGRHVAAYGPLGIMSAHTMRQGERFPEFNYATGQPATWDPEGGVWFTDLGYRLERADADGSLRRVLGVQTPESWNLSPLYLTFEEMDAATPDQGRPEVRPPHQQPDRPRGPRPMVRPRGRVEGVRPLGDGLLLVLVHVPGRDWREVRRDLDTMLDVIDAESGAVIARTRASGALRVGRSGILYRPSVDELGVVRVEVFDVVVDR